MLITKVFAYALAFTAAIPTAAAATIWDDKLKLYKLDFELPNQGPKVKYPALWVGSEGCNGVPSGQIACGNFGSGGTAIYKCVKGEKGWERGWLKRQRSCAWASDLGGQCVRNQRRKGFKFYPFEKAGTGVCIQPNDL